MCNCGYEKNYYGVKFVNPELITIGANVTIDPNVTLYGEISIGNNVHISAGCVIGSMPFIYRIEPDELPDREKVLGGVIIEDNVDIGAGCTVDAGRVNTILRKGCKTDNLCQIAHDCDIGENVLMAAGTILGGHVTIGQNTRLGLNCTVRNRVVIGNDCFVGMAKFITRNMPDNTKITIYGKSLNNKKGFIK